MQRHRALSVFFSVALILAAVLMIVTPVEAETFRQISADARYEEQEFYEKLLYQSEVNTAIGGEGREHANVVLDGSGLTLFFRSEKATEGFSVCVNYSDLKDRASGSASHRLF